MPKQGERFSSQPLIASLAPVLAGFGDHQRPKSLATRFLDVMRSDSRWRRKLARSCMLGTLPIAPKIRRHQAMKLSLMKIFKLAACFVRLLRAYFQVVRPAPRTRFPRRRRSARGRHELLAANKPPLLLAAFAFAKRSCFPADGRLETVALGMSLLRAQDLARAL